MPTWILLLLHVPPDTESFIVTVCPVQTYPGPVMGAEAFTVTVVIAAQPLGIRYVITDVPAASPVTIPDRVPTVTLDEPVLQVPPGTALVSVIFAPAHTSGPPLIPERVFTAILVVLMHPLGSV